MSFESRSFTAFVGALLANLAYGAWYWRSASARCAELTPAQCSGIMMRFVAMIPVLILVGAAVALAVRSVALRAREGRE